MWKITCMRAKDIKQLGIAPMTSMFSCGTNERRMCDTIHPQIHDSDRLSMWRGQRRGGFAVR